MELGGHDPGMGQRQAIVARPEGGWRGGRAKKGIGKFAGTVSFNLGLAQAGPDIRKGRQGVKADTGLETEKVNRWPETGNRI